MDAGIKGNAIKAFPEGSPPYRILALIIEIELFIHGINIRSINLKESIIDGFTKSKAGTDTIKIFYCNTSPIFLGEDLTLKSNGRTKSYEKVGFSKNIASAGGIGGIICTDLYFFGVLDISKFNAV